MRRSLISLGSLAAAGMLALAVPQSAYAANGYLFLNHTTYKSPSGCYPAGDRGASVYNETDAVVEFFYNSACADMPVGFISHGFTHTVPAGGSVRVP
jgi:hypothetical protein